MHNRLVLTGVGLALTTSMICAPLVAHADVAASRPSTSISIADTVWSLPANEWEAIAAKARAANDSDGASFAGWMSSQAGEIGAPGQGRNIWTAIAKKAVIQVLRYSVNKLPAKIRPTRARSSTSLRRSTSSRRVRSSSP
jgi:hypothetical protein